MTTLEDIDVLRVFRSDGWRLFCTIRDLVMAPDRLATDSAVRETCRWIDVCGLTPFGYTLESMTEAMIQSSRASRTVHMLWERHMS